MEKQLKLIRSRRYEHYLGQRGAALGMERRRSEHAISQFLSESGHLLEASISYMTSAQKRERGWSKNAILSICGQ